jgi:hypothetical protein
VVRIIPPVQWNADLFGDIYCTDAKGTTVAGIRRVRTPVAGYQWWSFAPGFRRGRQEGYAPTIEEARQRIRERLW